MLIFQLHLLHKKLSTKNLHAFTSFTVRRGFIKKIKNIHSIEFKLFGKDEFGMDLKYLQSWKMKRPKSKYLFLHSIGHGFPPNLGTPQEQSCQ